MISRPKYAILNLLIILCTLPGLAQFAAIGYQGQFERLDQDSVVFNPATGIRGVLSWQYLDGQGNWMEMDTMEAGRVLAFVPETTATYRLKVAEGTCNPVYSDEYKVYSRDTPVSEYVDLGVSASDLLEAGVPL